MQILKIKLLRKRERGIALLFTLIVLSLLLILALGFALNSMFDQKAAYNSANASFAAFLAQTQLKQVLSLIKNDEANLDNSIFYSHDSVSPVVTDLNMLKDMLSERLPVADLLDSIDTNKVNWNYIRSEDSEKRIIGRTAFVAITGGTPLDSLVDGRAGTTAYPKHDEKLNSETRIGKYVSEINVRASLPSATDLIAEALNWTSGKPVSGAGFTNGKYTGNWQSFTNLFSIIEAAIGSSLSTAQKDEFKNNLSIVVARDKEAFWADTNADTNIDSDELYKRFDLARDWNTADNAADLAFIKDKILLTSGTSPDVDMEKWVDTDSTAGSAGLPWLACFGYKDDGTLYTTTDLSSTFPSVSAHRCQIAANLKDYCDDDGGINRPTSDVDPTIASATNWVNCVTHPTFTGNEKTPYINTAGFKITALRTESGSGSSYTVGTDIEITPCIGLINIYGSNWPSEDLTVVIKGDVDIQTTVGTNNKTTPVPNALDCTITIVKDVTGDWTTTGYSKFKMSSSAYTKSTTGHSVSLPDQSISVKVTGIKINKIVLHNGTVAYDYTKLLETPSGYSREFFSGTSGGGTGWFGFAVHDPRQNLNNGDWLCLTSSSVDDPKTVFSLTGTDPYYGAANADNSVIANRTEAPSIGGASADAEGTVTDPANASLSTAFIRNALMESPWELGFIHRGLKWQTVNLKKYDPLKAYQTVNIGTRKYIPGGGLYSAGDANILDQIKMTPKAYSPQKINLKSQKTVTFDNLFSKIKLECSIDNAMSVNSMAGIDPATGTALSGTEINLSGSDYTNMRTNIINMFKITGTANRTRAGVAGELVLPAGAATDAAQEELTGKIVNLTKVNGKVDTFTIVILAQMIKDVGGPSGNPFNVTKYSGDASVSGTKGCEVGIFNADINDINNSKKNIYYDEIIAEQKIIVKGYHTIDGNVKITSFQYVE